VSKGEFFNFISEFQMESGDEWEGQQEDVMNHWFGRDMYG